MSGFIKNLTVSNYEKQYGSNDKNIEKKYIYMFIQEHFITDYKSLNLYLFHIFMCKYLYDDV